MPQTTVGLAELGYYSINRILKHHLCGDEKNPGKFKKDTVKINGRDYDIYINEKTHTIITCPLAATEKQVETTKTKPLLTDMEKALLSQKTAYANFHLIAPVVGQGIQENHIVTVYKAQIKSTKRTIIDSRAQKTFEIPNSALHDEWIRLGTQSLTDRATCGYHTLSNIQMCHERYSQSAKDDSIETYLREKIKNKSPVEYGLQLHYNAKDHEEKNSQSDEKDLQKQPIKPVPDVSFKAHAKKAWSTYADNKLNVFNLVFLPLQLIKESTEYLAEKIHVSADRSTGGKQFFWSVITGALHTIQAVANLVPAGFDHLTKKFISGAKKITDYFSQKNSAGKDDGWVEDDASNKSSRRSSTASMPADVRGNGRTVAPAPSASAASSAMPAASGEDAKNALSTNPAADESKQQPRP